MILPPSPLSWRSVVAGLIAAGIAILLRIVGVPMELIVGVAVVIVLVVAAWKRSGEWGELPPPDDRS